MRARFIKDSLLVRPAAVLAACALAIPPLMIACVHEERRPPIGPQVEVEPPAQPKSFGMPQYLVADPSSSRASAIALPLGPRGVHGLVVDKRRVVVGQGEPRVASDATTETILGASRIPGRFGNGFLFWTANTLYRADAFDAKLVPLTRVPDAIDSISFAPKSLLARTHDGKRWGIALPGGERAAIVPLGVADVQALDDGRAISFSDQGTVFTSTDGGAHWADVTALVKSSPAKVSIVSGELWLVESNGGASRLELDGHLSWFDKLPSDEAAELRPRDPRWRGSEAPLRTVFHAGAAIDDGTAIVIEAGDVVRVDVHTGDVVSLVPGRLPPDAHCEAVPTPGDVLFACSSHAGGSAFVVSHTLSSEPPALEQTLAAGGQFFAGDDGGLAYTGSCQGVPPNPAAPSVVCVRLPGGIWEEHDVSGLASDGGTSDVNVARWVPRQDGHIVALVTEPNVGIYDPRAQTFQAITDDAREAIGRASSYRMLAGKHGRIIRYKRNFVSGNGLVDTSWSFGSGGTLRGWQRQGESVEIAEDGKLTRSPYTLDVAFAGALGLGRSTDGRLYQSNDHGASWVEVATPPPGAESLDLVSCTSAGCDLGSFYRVGWALRPPRIEAPKQPAPAAPEVRRVRGLELACRPQGAVTSEVLPRTVDSPDDLGLGMSRLQVANERNDWSFVRNGIARGIVSPIHDPPGGESDAAPSLRALLSGFGTTRDGDVITVAGPNKNALALRRGVSYVAPFDPSGKIIRTGIAMSDVVAAGRRVGMSTDEILTEDFTEGGTMVTLTSADPAAPSDIALHNVDHGLLAIFRGERVRVAIRSPQNSTSVVSGVVLPGAGGGADEYAFLEVDSSGVGHVFKVAAGVATDLFDVSPTANETYYPANPDALAVGPKGDLAILRTPSGSEPASALDPAYLIVPAMPLVPLAPWSELKLADDPACKSEPGGYRAALQMMGPWIRVTTPELRVDESPMIARVRWTPKRVCLEGFEVRVPPVNVRVPQAESGYESASVATWLVGKGGTYARVGVVEGVEWRQALECTIATTSPGP